MTAFRQHGRRLAFARQLQAIVSSGLAWPVALAEMERHAPDPAMRAAVLAARRALQQGGGIGTALAEHPAVCDPQVAALIAAGEESGTLEQSLTTAVADLDSAQSARRQVARRLFPLLFTVVGFALVVPALALPAAARAGESDLVGAYFRGLASSLALLAAGVAALVAGPVLLRALGVPPLFWRSFASARFLRTLGRSLGAGLDWHRSVKLAGMAAGLEGVTGFRDLPAVDSHSKVTLITAERAGRLPEALERTATDLQDRGLQRVSAAAMACTALAAALLMGWGARAVVRGFGENLEHYQRIADDAERS